MELPETIPAVVRRAAETFPSREALVDDRSRLTFPDLEAAALEAGRALIAAGIQPGDRVGIWAPNMTEWVVAALGIYHAGAVLIPINTRFKGAEVAYILNKAKVRLLFSVTDFLGTNYLKVLHSEVDAPSLETIVALGEDTDGDAVSWSSFLGRAQDVPPEEVEARSGKLSADDLSDILFTSGTTGQPKGAMLTHGASIRAYQAWSGVIGLEEGDRYLIVNPFFHAFGLKAGILACLITGATMIPQPVFDVDAIMARVAQERVTMLPGPPTVYQSILDHPRLNDVDISSLRLAVTGAAVVPVELIRRMRSELTFKTIVTGYGLTEATGIATMCRHDDDAETIATTAGRAIPGVEVRVVDDAGEAVEVAQPGEVVVKGYNIMKGYLDDPAATGEAIDHDGWLHTGDIGTLDGRGNLRITDRKKDMFIVGGFNAYPAEIENIILQHPAIAQVAVVGIPDARMGEVGYAYVMLRPGKQVEPADLIEWCRARMANYKVPRHVKLVESFPLNATGKVLKYQLREQARSALSQSPKT
jgi:acyl-CoA synthetase (AMP-forming)/AMP-acid ligase II